MTLRLQQFGHKDCSYERPNQNWVCGWAADGHPCKLGPDGKGHCSSGPQSCCEPRKQGDRWFCTRPELHGGPCTPGPLPDGACCHPEPTHHVCQPRLSLRARRGRLTRSAVVYSFAALLFLLCGPWGLNFISPGELSEPHGIIAIPPHAKDNCAACHVSDAQTAGLMRPTNDLACVACHMAVAHQPARSIGQIGARVPSVNRLGGSVSIAENCTSCHHEHRGRKHELIEVSDASCTACHQDLKPWRRAMDKPAPSPHFAGVIVSTVLPALPANSADKITSFDGDHPEFSLLTDSRFDTTPLRFEHQVHLNAQTQGMQEQLAAWVEAQRKKGVPAASIPVLADKSGVMSMSCTMCHVPDQSGRYMQPIRFENHCATCHELGNKSGEPVPHGPGIKPFVLRVSLKMLAAPPPAPAATSGGPKRGPGGPRPASAPPPAEPLQFENPEALGKYLDAKLVNHTAGLNRSLATACGKCHGPKADPAEIVSPSVPARWLTRSTFDHSAHRAMTCASCHTQAMPGSVAAALPGIEDENSDASRLKWTGRTKDVMIPSIEMCRACHTPKSTVSSLSERNHCITCHRYHEPTPPALDGGKLAPVHVTEAARP